MSAAENSQAGLEPGAAEYHVPVMAAEISELYASLGKVGAFVLDCTLGAGGHALALLSTGTVARYAGIDADPEARKRASDRLEAYSGTLSVLPGFFDEVLAEKSREQGFGAPDFILFDLGLSTHHYAESGRGFSLAADEPLDMRLSPELPVDAADIVNRTREDKLADILYNYGEERYSRRIARAIVEARKISPIRTSARLASVIASAVPPAYRHGRIHPATRSFQAIRIEVNGELDRIERALPLAAELLAPGGILAIISFHSLEDRIAKRFCRAKAAQGFEELFKTPRSPSEEEVRRNPPSRSAKLRALKKAGAEASA